MPHLESLVSAEAELNPGHLGEWPRLVGSFILNFSAIEFASIQFLNLLEPTRSSFNKTIRKRLSRRIDRIVDLLKAADEIPENEKCDLVAAWENVRTGAKWRNLIAHNPIIWSWVPDNDPERDPPDALGIPDMRGLSSSDRLNSLSCDYLEKLIHQSATIGKRLNDAALELGARK